MPHVPAPQRGDTDPHAMVATTDHDMIERASSIRCIEAGGDEIRGSAPRFNV
jgi:hypothetical protein